MTEKISFVVVTWNSEKTIGMCVDGIVQKCGAEELDYEIFIVDNGSSDRTVETIEKYDGVPISLIRLSKNKGTTYTRNLALKKSSGKVICIIDSDASFIEGSLREVISELMNDSSIGILAPKIIESSGNIQTSVRKFPSVLGKISRIPKIIFKMNIKEFDSYKEFPFMEKTEVDCAISACWFFRSGLYEEIGLLDERIFYSPEDVDYCIRTRKNGKKILYYPEFEVLHKTQQITHNKFFSKIAFSHLFGLVYYFLKHKYISKPTIK